MAKSDSRLSFLRSSRAIAVVAPHPDDETLGCGGLIALAAAASRRVVVAALTDGAASHPGSRLLPPCRLGERRVGEQVSAVRALGAAHTDLVRLELPDGALDDQDAGSVSIELERIFQAWAVGAVFVTGPEDPHPDHRAAFDFAARAAGRVGAALWTYPVRAHVARAAVPVGVHRLPIAEVLHIKADALSRHATQFAGGVPDAPDGFALTPEDLAIHLSPHEVFVRRSSTAPRRRI